jgi:hypothetical protein
MKYIKFRGTVGLVLRLAFGHTFTQMSLNWRHLSILALLSAPDKYLSEFRGKLLALLVERSEKPVFACHRFFMVPFLSVASDLIFVIELDCEQRVHDFGRGSRLGVAIIFDILVNEDGIGWQI